MLYRVCMLLSMAVLSSSLHINGAVRPRAMRVPSAAMIIEPELYLECAICAPTAAVALMEVQNIQLHHA